VAAEPHSTAAPGGASVAPGVHAARVGAQVFVDGRVLVGFHDGVSATARRRIERAISTSTPRQITPALDLLPISSGHVLAAVRALKAQPEVRYAEPDYVARSSGAPNDPFFGQQWGFSNTGQLVNGTTGTAGADEHAVPAWSVATGSRSVVIAETDTGVDYNHPDLAANIWSNPGGVGGCPAGTHGYDVLTATCDPMDDDTSYGGHGTHVAGILGAQGNNGVGVSGVNWAANSNDSSGSSSGLIAALDWVLRAKRDYNVNVRVVNDSATFVGTAYSQALSAEISALGQNNILFVTAAGNTGDDMTANPSTLRYPCGYHLANEICVTASDQNDQRWSSANYGATAVDLAAPGVNVYSTLRNNSYGYISGGSMASPQVAGTAALVLSRQDMTTTDLKAEILNHVDVLPSLNGLVRTGGRLDVCKALPGCPGAPVISSPADGTSTNSSMVTLSGSAEPGSSIEVFDGSTPQATMTTDGSGRWSDAMTAVADGQHSYTARATVAGGSTSAASAPVVHVTVNTHEPVAPSSSAPTIAPSSPAPTTAPASPAPTTAPTSPAPVGPASASGPRSVAPVAASQADGAVAARSSIRALARRLARAGPLALLRLGGSHPLALRWPQAGRYSLSWSARTPPSAADRVARGTGRRRRAKLMVVLIGGGSATRTEAGPGGLALTLTGAGRRYLRMVKTGRTLLQATFQPANGTQATIVSIVVFVAVPRNHARSKR